jgi:hypothetical protein
MRDAHSFNFQTPHTLPPPHAGFLSRFEGASCPAELLEEITIIDTPGVLSGEKQRIERNYNVRSRVCVCVCWGGGGMRDACGCCAHQQGASCVPALHATLQQCWLRLPPPRGRGHRVFLRREA